MGIVRTSDLPSGENSEAFYGHEHGASISFFLSHHKPGSRVRLHKHPYEETFIVQEGTVVFTVGEEQVEATAGDIVVAPAEVPHAFESRGHRSINIHPVAEMQTEWLE